MAHDFSYQQDFHTTILDRSKTLAKHLQDIVDAEIEIVDIDGNVIPVKTNKSGEFSAYVDPYEVYTINTKKEGYNDNVIELPTNSATERVFKIEVNLIIL